MHVHDHWDTCSQRIKNKTLTERVLEHALTLLGAEMDHLVTHGSHIRRIHLVVAKEGHNFILFTRNKFCQHLRNLGSNKNKGVELLVETLDVDNH